jgi:hypothetical protein
VYILYKNECKIFKPIEITIRKGLRWKEERMDQFGYNTYIQRNVTVKLCIVILSKNVFYQKQRTGRQNRSCLEAGTGGRGEDEGKGCRRVNTV